MIKRIGRHLHVALTSCARPHAHSLIGVEDVDREKDGGPEPGRPAGRGECARQMEAVRGNAMVAQERFEATLCDLVRALGVHVMLPGVEDYKT